MKVLLFIFIVFTIFKNVYCEWIDAANKACENVGRTLEYSNMNMRNQCVVKCVKEGESITYEKLENDSECEKFIFRTTGKCRTGVCRK